MELTRVSCYGCGAALQVPEGARFVTCRYCNASLEIKRNETTIYTETLERIDQRTAEMAEDLDAIRHEHEIERLDREWALRRAGFMTRSKDGTSSEPSMVGGILAMVIGGGFGLFWTVTAFSITSRGMAMGAPGGMSIFPLFGVVFIVAAIVSGLTMMSKAMRFQQAQRDYQRQREEMQARKTKTRA
jgi:LSD1 subclass zinc finger protein